MSELLNASGRRTATDRMVERQDHPNTITQGPRRHVFNLKQVVKFRQGAIGLYYGREAEEFLPIARTEHRSIGGAQHDSMKFGVGTTFFEDFQRPFELDLKVTIFCHGIFS